MVSRYNSTGTMNRSSTGRFVAFAEHEKLVQDFLETLGEYFRKIERGEQTAQDAEVALRTYVALR
jgi:hypothetical protein